MVFVKLVLLVCMLLSCLLIKLFVLHNVPVLGRGSHTEYANNKKNISEIHKALGNNECYAMLHLDFLHHYLLVKIPIH